VINVAADEAARAKLTAARDRIIGGEDAAAVVEEVSESALKANGGLIGPVNLADLAPALQSAVGELAEGDVSMPIRNQTGYQIFRMESRTDTAIAPFEDVREEIYQGILSERAVGETAKYLERMMDQAVIDWKDDIYRKLYEQGVSEREAGR
jgi:parvulin-like peptidyl-prolyl isomerase